MYERLIKSVGLRGLIRQTNLSIYANIYFQACLSFTYCRPLYVQRVVRLFTYSYTVHAQNSF